MLAIAPMLMPAVLLLLCQCGCWQLAAGGAGAGEHAAQGSLQTADESAAKEVAVAYVDAMHQDYINFKRGYQPSMVAYLRLFPEDIVCSPSRPRACLWCWCWCCWRCCWCCWCWYWC